MSQKMPEETAGGCFRRQSRSTTFKLQMGQILCFSDGSKTCSRYFRVSSLTLLLSILFYSSTWVNLVGAIPSTESPLNLNVNLESEKESTFFTATPRRGGDELRGSERDVFLSSGVTNNPTPFESKFTSNGQFVRSTLTEATSGDGDATNSKTSRFLSSGSPNPTLTSSQPIFFQSESPLPRVIIPGLQGDGDSKLNLRQQPLTSPQSRGEETLTPSTSTLLYSSSEEEGREKPSNINLLRKLWSSNRRSSKLNLTHEHQSLLRIESEKSNRSGVSIKTTTTSRSLADLLDIDKEAKELYPTSFPGLTTPSSISSSVPFSEELTSLRPTSLKLELKSERPATTSSTTTTTSSTYSSTTSDTSVHSIKGFKPGSRPTSAPSETELSTSIPNLQRNTPKARISVGDSFPKPSSFSGGRTPPMMLYPEWLSSGGVYPDDSTNGTGEYYGESEYENLINSNENNGGNPGERQEENPVRRMQFRKRINTEFLERVANQSWQNRLKLREQQVIRESTERESRIAASLAAVSAEANAMSTENPEAIIAQNGLADVISRGRIDSVMYVYFGDKYNDYHKEEIAGRIIQAVGGVIAAIAQVLTVLGAAKCVRKSSQSSTQPPVHLHIGFALLISNLLLLLAVHATEPADVCGTVAMILHYLHLVIGCWLFAHTVRTYFKLRRHSEAPNLVSSDPDDRPREMKRTMWSSSIRYCFAAWTAPLPFIIMSYLANPDGYETRHYCWMSIEKGMVVSFIVPVFLLIGLNTFLVVLSLRHLLAQRKLWADSSSAEMDEDSLDERKISSGIRASAMLLPLLAIMWFLGVVALENASSIFFQIAGASANIALSWLVLYFLGDEAWPEMCCYFYRRDQMNSNFSIEDSYCVSGVQPGAQVSFDNEPLLGASSSAVPSTSSEGAPEIGNACPLYINKPILNISKIPAIPGPSRSGKRQHKTVKKPNWSTPGGNEIYELKVDSISTICK